MPRLSDVELRLLLIVVRQTLGWIEDPELKTRKTEDWISSSQLVEKSGRSRKHVSKAMKELIEVHQLVIAVDSKGRMLDSAEKRRAKFGKIFYRLNVHATAATLFDAFPKKTAQNKDLTRASKGRTEGEDGTKRRTQKGRTTKETHEQKKSIHTMRKILHLRRIRSVSIRYQLLCARSDDGPGIDRTAPRSVGDRIARHGASRSSRSPSGRPGILDRRLVFPASDKDLRASVQPDKPVASVKKEKPKGNPDHKTFLAFWDEMVPRTRGIKPLYTGADMKNLKRILDFGIPEPDLEQIALYFLADYGFKSFSPSISTLCSAGIINGLLNRSKNGNDPEFWRNMNRYMDQYLRRPIEKAPERKVYDPEDASTYSSMTSLADSMKKLLDQLSATRRQTTPAI
jgi:biotin operon repressor